MSERQESVVIEESEESGLMRRVSTLSALWAALVCIAPIALLPSLFAQEQSPADVSMTLSNAALPEVAPLLCALTKKRLVVPYQLSGGPVTLSVAQVTRQQATAMLYQIFLTNGWRVAELDNSTLGLVTAAETKPPPKVTAVEIEIRDKELKINGEELTLDGLADRLRPLIEAEADVWIYDHDAKPWQFRSSAFDSVVNKVHQAGANSDMVYRVLVPPTK